jgi:hypothetical protein
MVQLGLIADSVNQRGAKIVVYISLCVLRGQFALG